MKTQRVLVRPVKKDSFDQNLDVAQTFRQQIIPWYMIKAQCMIHHFLQKTLPFTLMRQISQSYCFNEILACNKVLLHSFVQK